MKTENGFREEFSFLSNFTYFEKPMVVHREDYVFSFPTNEHFYQACKFKDYEMIMFVSKHPSKGLKKFINSKKSEWREDWDEIKLGVMWKQDFVISFLNTILNFVKNCLTQTVLSW